MPQADGKKIRQLREQRGWSQDKLVDEVAKLKEKDGSIEAPIVKRTIQRLEMGCRAYPHTLYVEPPPLELQQTALAPHQPCQG